ncbi:hypothetical protein BJY04DRAFT_217632 [Aspergillus karnatakaensis]|uniref:nucleic acid/nucleotide deaminase domain-containing protein n=1 Tax=Aspergillus karnatakaensis TaxID=1810916 RepID=UPI003CCDA72F
MARVSILPPPSLSTTKETLAWHLPGGIESEITTLAAVCQIKRQQRTPLAQRNEDAIHDIDSSDNEQHADHERASTGFVAPPRTGGKKSIKMLFLDHVAQILCYKKHAHYVTCAAMKEGSDEVTILVARNAPWKEKDTKLLEDLASLLEHVAAGEAPDMESSQDLQQTLIEYYFPRLQYHAQKLLALLEKAKSDSHQEAKETKNIILCLKAFISGTIPPQAFIDVVEKIHYSTTFSSELQDLFKGDQVKQQIRELGCIRRPVLANSIFQQAARELSSFQSIKILLLPGSKGKRVTPDSAISHQLRTDKVHRSLELELDKVKWVHAEIIMVLHLISTDCAAKVFPYLGISKKTCFLCGHFLRGFDLFQARGNHGKVYSQWTLPSRLAIPAAYRDRLEQAIRYLRNVLHDEAAAEHQRLGAVKESTISTPVAAPERGSWSLFSRHVPDQRMQAREAEWLSRQNPGAQTRRQLQEANTPDFQPQKEDTNVSEPDSPTNATKARSRSCVQCGSTSGPLLAALCANQPSTAARFAVASTGLNTSINADSIGL